VTSHSAIDARWQAFEHEAMPHVDRLFRHAMWLEQNRAAAEDLVQDTLVQALQSFDRFTPGTSCRAWLVTILHHVRANRLRKQGRAPIDLAGDDQMEAVPFVSPIPEALTDDDLLQALRCLPPRHQQVILLCDVEEMSYKEIAAALDVPIGTVMSRLHRGRALLRTELTRAGLGPRPHPPKGRDDAVP
jgi:RNA polymerase sigma-70 factor (ECF subfamily)